MENVRLEDRAAGQVKDGCRKEDFVILYSHAWKKD